MLDTVAARLAALDPQDTAAAARASAERRRTSDLAARYSRLRPYQVDMLARAMRFVAESRGGSRLLLAAPCATGKGTTQLALVAELGRVGVSRMLLTPSVEILRGNLERMGLAVPDSPDAVGELALAHGMATPVRFLNRLAAGEIEAPDVIIADEVHGFVDSNTVPHQLFTLLADSRWIGFTATPFRATARGTQELRDAWGEPAWGIRLAEAVAQRFITFPDIVTAPLVDDDRIRVVNGEVDAAETESAYLDRLDGLADIVEAEHRDGGRRVVVAVSSTAVARELVAVLTERGVPASAVLQDTPGAERAAIYSAAQGDERRVLVQIRVLSVGADLPRMDCLVDAQPTMSPVLWLQTVGRIMRLAPGKDGALYVCTNRNLERHHYLLEGLAPSATVAESQELFGSPSARAGARMLGFENLSSKKARHWPLSSGGWLTYYALSSSDRNGKTREYFVAFAPGEPAPLCAARVNASGAEGRSYGRWAPVVLPDDLSGFNASARRDAISEKQLKWWNWPAKGAPSVGLAIADAVGEPLVPTPLEFVALPAARDCDWFYGRRPERSASSADGALSLADALAVLRQANGGDRDPV